jgi:F-type H+-transporting ATPase subunit c
LFIQSFKFLGAGLSTIALAGAGVGIGHIFANLLVAIAISPENSETLFSYAILGFALTEAIALFGLMMAFLILFAL